MSNAKLERLMNLIALLSESNKPLTFREIASMIPGYPESINAARRTFERDKEELRSMNFNVDVVLNPDQESAYRINKTQTYYDVPLTPAQRSTVEYALELYSPKENLAIAAITKLGGLNPENTVENINSLPLPKFVEDAMAAIKNKNIVKITFRAENRIIKPQKLIARSGYWYLESFDLGKNESRTFRIDRIESFECIEILDPIRNDKLSDQDAVEDSSVKFVVAVHDSLQTNFANDWNADTNAQGFLEFIVPRKEIFTSRLFDYSGFVSIIEPTEVAQEIEIRFQKLKAVL